MTGWGDGFIAITGVRLRPVRECSGESPDSQWLLEAAAAALGRVPRGFLWQTVDRWIKPDPTAALIWQMWKQRSDYVFNGVALHADSAIHRSHCWALCYESHFRTPTNVPRRPVRTTTWTLPPPEWICLNTDGSVTDTRNYGAIGGVIRNSNGDWITGFARNVGSTSILQAELWGIYEGLLIAWSLGIPRLLVQSDCSQAVNLVNSEGASDCSIPLVRAIVSLRKRAWTKKIVWIARTCYKIVDRMAKVAPDHRFGLFCFSSPSDELASLLTLEASSTLQEDFGLI
ncbi:hypothetical protein F3Y22_tig00110904pilonHSYRG00066 [Hibiscus syriacus]|uniref:RNase H type-1 domain-containing protein n=1 Tax=Hibiscus syriacus TaxID=106335 RepID=A0A6A2ZF98_HIBSY|nr:hypothetical protein F3Y22_tig00110904pilonHSYRG00066 [Hibiscus syriacus]